LFKLTSLLLKWYCLLGQHKLLAKRNNLSRCRRWFCGSLAAILVLISLVDPICPLLDLLISDPCPAMSRWAIILGCDFSLVGVLQCAHTQYAVNFNLGTIKFVQMWMWTTTMMNSPRLSKSPQDTSINCTQNINRLSGESLDHVEPRTKERGSVLPV
jgi:hypothetical protein